MRDIEIIIVDDKSNDKTIEIIHKFMEEDKRIKLIKIKIEGKYYFLNQQEL